MNRELPAILLSVLGVCVPVSAASTSPSSVNLRSARRGFTTRIIHDTLKPDGPATRPPEDVFRIVRFPSPKGKLVAYITPLPKDGTRRPAVIWAHGGFGGIGDWLWKEPQFTRAFRDAGFVVFCPSWRGENDNPGRFELFYGEVTDAVAAVNYVSALPYVDRNRVYIAGHSSGGTIAMLAAMSTAKLRAAFSFGGRPNLYSVVKNGRGYGNTPFDHRNLKESYLRSPIHFIKHLNAPIFYFEGKASPCAEEALEMASRSASVGAPFEAFVIEGGDHFNILAPMTRLVAGKIKSDTGAKCGIRVTALETKGEFARYQAAVARQRRLSQEADDLRELADLKEAGADFSKVHKLCHFFYSFDRAEVVPARQAARKRRLGTVSEIESNKDDDGDSYYSFTVIVPTSLALEKVFADSGRMARFAAELEIEYDGWTARPVE